MSGFWSAYVAILSIGCWVFVTGALIFTLRLRPELDEQGTTGHEYDGIYENDNPMPRWWLIVFWATIVWAVVYFALYPALGNFKGFATIERLDGSKVNWTSVNEMQNQYDRNNKVFLDNFDKKFRALDVAALAQNPKALKAGQGIFLQNCSICHGTNAKGALGYPNLTDNDWLYGGTPDKIVETITKGRTGGMPTWQATLGEDGVKAATQYVLSLSKPAGITINPVLAAQGAVLFKENCAVCHGPDGKGSQSVGAPNLTDNTWLYGGTVADVEKTIRLGRAGKMPAWEHMLGAERIKLVAAYVYSQTH